MNLEKFVLVLNCFKSYVFIYLFILEMNVAESSEVDT